MASILTPKGAVKLRPFPLFAADCIKLYQRPNTELAYSVSNYMFIWTVGGTEVQRNIAEGEGNFLNFWFLQLENTARLDATRNLLNAM